MKVTRRSHSKTQLSTDLWLPAADLHHHAVLVEVLQVPLLPVVLIDLTLSYGYREATNEMKNKK